MALQSAMSFDIASDPKIGGEGWYDFTSFGQQNLVGGRFGGYALEYRNTGFGEKDVGHAIDHHNLFWWGAAYYQYVSGDGWPAGVEIFRLFSGSNPIGGPGSSRLLTLRTRADLKLDVLVTNSLIQRGPTTIAMNANTWYYLEVVYNVGGTVQVYINDTLVAQGPVSDPQFPTGFVVRRESFNQSGINFDDMVFGDESGTDPNFATRIGPVKIKPWFMEKDDQVNWTRNTGTTNSAAVAERYPTVPAPDGEASYVKATSGGLIDLYDINQLRMCDGRILALTANLNAYSPSGMDGGGLNVIARIDPTQNVNTTIGRLLSLTAAYKTYQSIVTASPKTHTYWTDGEIEDALWGLNSTFGSSRVSAFWIEKIVSLRVLSFDCSGGAGANSYAVKSG